MPSQWYYVRNKQRMGPVYSSELKRLAASGHSQPTDMVLKEGHQKWIPASTVKGLFPKAPAEELVPIPGATPNSGGPKEPPTSIGVVVNPNVYSALDGRGKRMSAKAESLEKASSSQKQQVASTTDSGTQETRQNDNPPQHPAEPTAPASFCPPPLISNVQPARRPIRPRRSGTFAKLKRRVHDTLKGLSDSNTRQRSKGTSSAYVPALGSKELAKVIVVKATPTRIKPNTTLRIFVEPEEIVFVECAWFGKEKVVLRFPKHDVFLARWQKMPASVSAQLMHEWCNKQMYGKHTGAIVSAIEGPIAANCLAVGIHDPSLANERQVLVLARATLQQNVARRDIRRSR